MKIKLLFYFSIIATPLFVAGQEWQTISTEEMAKEILKSGENFRKHSSFEITVTHRLFKFHDAIEPYEITKGYFKKHGNSYHSFILNIHTIQGNDHKAIVDPADQTIQIANPDFTDHFAQQEKYLIETLAGFKGLKKSGNKSGSRLLLENPPGMAVKAYEFVNDKDGRLKEMITYYNEIEEEESNGKVEMLRPKISIVYGGFNSRPKFDPSGEFSAATYIQISKTGKILPNPEFKHYKISDHRGYLKN